MKPSSVTPSIEQLRSLARLGAEKAGRLVSDADELNELANFIGQQRDARQEGALVELETRLRQEDRRALAWYLTLVRTLCGTVPGVDYFQHLVFIPVQMIGPGPLHLSLKTAAQEVAGSLEYALDLGHGSLQLSPEVVSLHTLESISRLRWYEMAKGADFALPAEPFEGLGGIVGRWNVPANDRMRLSRKLLHAAQPTPSLKAWRMRTESLLEENTPGIRARIFPVVQLQDLFPLLRQVRLSSQLEQGARQCGKVRSLNWCWLENSGELTWRLSCEGQELVSGSAAFPDESADLVESQLGRLAQRLQLKLSPPLS